MTVSTTEEQRKGMMELFQGEVIGEALFDAMLHHCSDERERYVIGTMLQLETETKARLRQAAAQRGMDYAEDSKERDAGEALAKDLSTASWAEKMKALHDILNDTYVPRYKEIDEAAGPDDKELTAYMVIHETSLLEASKRELDGRKTDSVGTILPQLRYPLPVPTKI